jgi:hypothetical protein
MQTTTFLKTQPAKAGEHPLKPGRLIRFSFSDRLARVIYAGTNGIILYHFDGSDVVHMTSRDRVAQVTRRCAPLRGLRMWDVTGQVTKSVCVLARNQEQAEQRGTAALCADEGEIDPDSGEVLDVTPA